MAAIQVELELADGTFTQRMMRAGQTVEQFKNQVIASSPKLQQMATSGQDVVKSMSLASTQTRSFSASLRDVAIVTGLVGLGISKLVNIQSTWAGSIVRVNTEFERLIFQMRSMSTAADPIREAGDNVNYLRRAALDMPFRLSTINAAFVKLKATGTDPLNGSLQAIADGVAAFGGTDESFNRVVLGISQMSGKGVIQMEELRQQLGEQMPTAVAVMARSMGVSMSRLIKDISTGTVSSKEALASFYRELDRSYGGRARYMMQTFEGQVKRMQTQLQNLALIAGGMNAADGSYTENGLMGTLRQQLRDINQLLEGDIGAQLASQIGSGLTSIVNFVRSTIETMIEFRNEIILVGKVLGVAFVAKAAIAGISGLMTSINLLITRIGVARAQVTGLQAAMAGQGFLSAAATATGALATAAATAVPLIAGVGLAVLGVANYFGVFDNKGKDAIETLRSFGATSREQLDLATSHIEEQERKLARLEAERQRFVRNSSQMGFVGATARAFGITREEAQARLRAKAEADYQAQLTQQEIDERKQLENEIAENRRMMAEAKVKFERQQHAAYVAKLRDDYEELMRVEQNRYVGEQYRIQEHYDRLEKEARDAGRSTKNIEEERGKTLLAEQVKWHKRQEAELLKSLVTQQALRDKAVDKTQFENAIADLEKSLIDVREKMRLAEAQQIGTPLIPKAADDQAKFDKGQQNLTRLRAEVSGLKAALGGANAEVVELQEVLANTSKYGHIEADGVRELIDNLVEATAQKEALDELMEGKNKLEGDIERVRMRNIEREMELRERALGRQLSDAERIKLRFEQGYYKGFGPASMTRKLLEGIVSSFDVQGKAADAVAKQIQDNTFGPRTVTQINSVTEAMARLFGVVANVGQAVGGISFDKFNMSGDGFLNGAAGAGGSPFVVPTNGGSILDLIASVESGGDYNATLDNGRWTGGAKDLTSMTLNQVRDLQRQMLSHPENRAKYGNGLGSSALGRYQIVGKTLEGLIKEMGLSGNELYDPAMQDRMGLQLLKRRQGQGVTGLRNEWEGLKNVSEEKILAALNGGNNMQLPSARAGQYAPAAPAAAAAPTEGYLAHLPQLQQVMDSVAEAQKSFVLQIDEEIKKSKELDNAEFGVKRAEALEKLKIAAQTTSEDVDGLNKNYNTLVNAIKAGDMGANKDVGAAEYRELIAAAQELDRVEKARGDRKKALTAVNNAEERFLQRQKELTERVAEASARMADPNELKSSSGYRALRQELEDYTRDVEAAYGRDTEAFRNAQAYKQQMLGQFRNMEVAESAAGWSKRTQEINRSLMSESQQRYASMQEEIARIDAEVAAFQGTEDEKVRIVAAAEAAKAALRQQYSEQSSPMSGMMKEWGDLQGNLAKASANWMNSLADGLTDLIMGTGDLRKVVQGMLRDVINMGLKFLMSQMFGGGKNGSAGGAKGKGGSALAGGKGGGKAGGKGGGKGPGIGMLFGAFHTGGVIGGRAPMGRVVSPSAFVGAPKFHTGGIIGGPKLASDEVPIIGKKGEGVFTPEQMEAMGGLSQTNFQIHAPINVQGSSGTPDQNNDLAKKMAREMEVTIKSAVADELRKQTRPGNFMNTRSR